MTEKVLGVCPHAVKLKQDQTIYGCSVRATRMLAGNAYKTYCPPCTTECAEGDYEKCPWFPS